MPKMTFTQPDSILNMYCGFLRADMSYISCRIPGIAARQLFTWALVALVLLFVSFFATVAQAQLNNTATATGTPASGTLGLIQATETVDLEDQAPSLTVLKTGTLVKGTGNTDPDGEVGDTINYEYTVTNAGNVTITDVEITDVHSGQAPLTDPAHTVLTDNGGTGDSPDSNPDATIWGTLAPLDVIKFTTSYTITQADMDAQ